MSAIDDRRDWCFEEEEEEEERKEGRE